MLFSRLMKSFVIVLVLIPVSLTASARAEGTETKREQTIFSSEADSVERPSKLPKAAFEAIRLDAKSVHSHRDVEIPYGALVASEIHLNGDGEVFLIVVGVGRPLRGANVVPFWVLRKANQGYEVLLGSGGGTLEVLETKTNGFRVINVYTPATLNTCDAITYVWDGAKYHQVQVAPCPSE